MRTAKIQTMNRQDDWLEFESESKDKQLLRQQRRQRQRQLQKRTKRIKHRGGSGKIFRTAVGSTYASKRTIGTYIGLIGIAIAITGALSPFYFLTIDADFNVISRTEAELPPGEEDYGSSSSDSSSNGESKKTTTQIITLGNFSTNGTIEVFRLDGIHGVILRTPKGEKVGGTQETKIPLPFGIYITISLVVSAILVLFASTVGRRVRRLIYASIISILPVVIILIVINQLPTIAEKQGYSEMLTSPFDTLIIMISHSPSGGIFPLDVSYEVSGEVGNYKIPYSDFTINVTGGAEIQVHITMIWGLAIGAYLLIIGAIVQVAGGITDYYLGKFNELKYRAYKEVLKRVVENGVISVDEDNLIQGLRQILKIPDSEYNKILDEVCKPKQE